MSNFTPAGSGGIPVTANIPGVTSPTVANVSIPTANIEQSYTFPADTKRFFLKLRSPSSATLKVAYTASTSGTVFLSLSPSAGYFEGEIDAVSLTIFFQSTLAGEILEILSWV